jgi:metal-responsive CopG/Arc/MetJ family transcriptional regulator
MNININNKMDNDIDSKTSRIGISLPSSLLLKIDKERGDISRSKFLFRI